MTLTPAYGRDYKNRASIVKDLNEGLDFVMQDIRYSGYCSVRDLPDGQHNVRNASLRKVWVINVNGGVAK
jgi:hypothetical protein